MSILDRFTRKNRLIVGIGSPLIDILAHENDAFLEKVDAVKGGMTYVEKETIDSVISRTSGKPSVVPGGSACNTVIGIAKLGGPSRFVGKCGNDDMGDYFKKNLHQQNVEPHIMTSSSPSGRVLSIITPDAQRSMLTFLGASAETIPEDISEACFAGAAVVHVEGYLLFNADLIHSVLHKARNAGAVISLDLASFTVVESSKAILNEIITEFVDILIANEDEAKALTGHSDEIKAIRALSERAEIAVLKVGKHGSYIAHAGDIIKVDPVGSERVVDTTGAGDLWASGFLFGLVNRYPLEECGRLGSICGYEVCRVVGTNIPQDGWMKIKQLLKS